MVPRTPSEDSTDDLPPRPSTAEHPVIEQLERAGAGTRWHMSRHTLELAIQVFETEVAPPPPSKGTAGKSRRRKRTKRLL